MPDGDVFSRVAVTGWKDAARQFHGQSTPDEVARTLMTCAAAAIRQAQGLAPLGPIAEILRRLACGEIHPGNALDQIQRLEVELSADPNTRAVARAARALVNAPVGAAPITEQLVEGTVVAMMELRVFDLMDSRFARYRFGGSIAAQRDFEGECRAAMRADPAFSKLVRRIVEDPSGRTVRVAPRRRKRSTSDWLATSVN